MTDTGGVQCFGTGPERVLALHCTLGSRKNWAGLADRLRGRASFLCPDLPGHGEGTEWKGGDYQATSVAQAKAVLEESPAHLVGHSYGASVALRLALEAPELVQSLTLIEPVYFAAVRGHDSFDALQRAMAPFEVALGCNDQKTAAQVFCSLWSEGPPLNQLPPRIQDQLARLIPLVAEQADGLYNDPMGILAAGVMEGMDLPVLLIEGSASQPIMHHILNVFEARLPRVTRKTVEGAGHMVPITHGEVIAPLLGAFIEAA